MSFLRVSVTYSTAFHVTRHKTKGGAPIYIWSKRLLTLLLIGKYTCLKYCGLSCGGNFGHKKNCLSEIWRCHLGFATHHLNLNPSLQAQTGSGPEIFKNEIHRIQRLSPGDGVLINSKYHGFSKVWVHFKTIFIDVKELPKLHFRFFSNNSC